MLNAVLIGEPCRVGLVFAMGRLERIAERVRLNRDPIHGDNLHRRLADLAEADVAFATWGTPAFVGQSLDAASKLRAVFYAAGSVKRFAPPLLDRGIRLCSAWRANAVPVSHFTLAHIILGLKGYFHNIRGYKQPSQFMKAPHGPGVFGTPVALLGAGAIGRLVIELLRPFELDVAVFDPFLGEAEARSLGVRKISLDEAFAGAFVVSNHLADVPATRGMIRESHFRSMRNGATFINTGRGATVDEPGMIAALRERPDLTAILDVTHPEPPAANSPLFTMPNVHLSGHIAGSIENECVRMADLMIEEFDRFIEGKPLQHEVTRDMLETMA